MKKLNKKTLKIVAATSMAVFSLLATMTSAYAWFQSTLNQNGNNEDFYVKRLDTPVTSITIHDFYGETDDEGVASFAFDPVGVSVYDGTFNDGARVVELNKYILEKPDHPVLILFKNEETTGYESQINLKTEFSYLGANDDFLAGKTSTYAELSALASKVTNGYYRVVEDENHSNKDYLYQWNGSSFTSVSFASYAALDVAGNRVAANDGKYFLVVDDEKHGDISTIYQYDDAKAAFDMVWCDLGDVAYSETNPLSSAVKIHTLTFTDAIEDMRSSRDINFEAFDDVGQDYNYTKHTGENCIAIPKADCNDSNKHSFTSFTNEETFNRFNKEINVFRGDVTNVTYIGLVINYDKTALEYVFSHNLGNEALNNGLEFKCDWITEF